jgi:hypothetical protein
MASTALVRFFTMTQPLQAVIPDLDELLARPAAVLGRQPLRIGPAPLHRLGLLAVPTGAIVGVLAPALFTRNWDGQVARIGLVVGLLLGLLLLVVALLRRRLEVLLGKEGVEFWHGRRSVWCPWALFSAPGNVLVNSDRLIDCLTLPVSPQAVPYVELRQDELCQAQGARVKTATFRFTSGDQVMLSGHYEVVPAQLGSLLLQLGRQLGTPLTGWVPEEAVPSEEPIPSDAGTADGWVTLRLTRLFFPPVCSVCGQPSAETMDFHACGRWNWFVALLTLGHVHGPFVTVRVPVCARCQQSYRRGQQRGTWLGVFSGLVLALLGVLALFPVLDAPGRFCLVGVALIFGPLIGFGIGLPVAERLRSPVRKAWYSSRRSLVRLRFRRPEYAGQVAECVRAAEAGR